MQKYLDAATISYGKIICEFPSFEIYWQLGHVFDSLIDYWDIAKVEPESDIIIEKYLNRGLIPFPHKKDDIYKWPLWHDDYCWWAISALRAGEDFSELFGNKANWFRGISDLNWTPVYRTAPNVWKNVCTEPNSEKEYFKDAKPAFEHGVWNWIYTQRSIDNIPYTPSVPQVIGLIDPSDQIHPIQNTVTNSLYWVLMCRLYNITKSKDQGNQKGLELFKEQAENESNFFEAWINSTSNADSGLFNHIDDTTILVRERVGYYAGGKKDPNYKSGLTWSGDQGLVLGGLVARMQMIGEESDQYETLLKRAKYLLNGVLSKLIGIEGDILPWNNYDKNKDDRGAIGGDFNDYSTGTAVLMKYMLYAYDNNKDLKVFLEQDHFVAMVKRNADAVVLNKDWKPVSKDSKHYLAPFLKNTNDLASLLLAVRMGISES